MKDIQIIKMYNNGVPIILIARMYNVSLHYVIKIVYSNIVRSEEC